MEQTHQEAKDWQVKAAIGLENAGAILVLAAIVSGFVGITMLGQSAWPIIWGGDFAGQAFWKFSHFDRAYHGFLNWDRAWWLIIIIPALLGAVASALGDLVGWLRRSPEERA